MLSKTKSDMKCNTNLGKAISPAAANAHRCTVWCLSNMDHVSDSTLIWSSRLVDYWYFTACVLDWILDMKDRAVSCGQPHPVLYLPQVSLLVSPKPFPYHPRS